MYAAQPQKALIHPRNPQHTTRLQSVAAPAVRRSAPRRKVRRQFLRTLVVLLVLLTVLLGAPRLVQMLGPAGAPQLASHTVAPGETLWGIAAQYRPGEDPRAVIEQIKQVNGLRSVTVQPGQVVLVPVAVK
jgi:LysM repeat protein